MISDITDNSTEGRLCRDVYPDLRDAVLEEGRWTFTRYQYDNLRATRLTEDQPDAPRYTYKFPIPEDLLLILRVGADAQNERQIPWAKIGNDIVCDYENIIVDAHRRVTDPRLWTATFRQALVYRIARDLALPLTENRAMMENMDALYQQTMDTALAVDGMQGRNEQTRPSRLVDIRVTGAAGSLFGG